jgi:hypothetical protein
MAESSALNDFRTSAKRFASRGPKKQGTAHPNENLSQNGKTIAAVTGSLGAS